MRSLAPKIEEKALAALKFGDCLPPAMQQEVLLARWSDLERTQELLSSPPTVCIATD